MLVDTKLADYLVGLGISGPEVAANLAEWNRRPVLRSGEIVGMTIDKGPEIHFISFSERKAMSRRNIIEHLAPLIEKYGYATTRVPIAEEDHRLRTKLGFHFTWEDDHFTYWCLTELPYQRNES